MISEREIQYHLDLYRKDNTDNRFYQSLRDLANNIYKLPNYHFEYQDAEVLLDDVADFCLLKVEKYNGKGKVFNYFTTIICCYIKQIKYAELRKRKVKHG